MNTAPATPSMAPSAEAAQSEFPPCAPKRPGRLASTRGRHRRRSDGRAYRRGFPGIRELIRDLSENPRKTRVYGAACAAISSALPAEFPTRAPRENLRTCQEKDRRFGTKAGKSNAPAPRFSVTLLGSSTTGREIETNSRNGASDLQRNRCRHALSVSSQQLGNPDDRQEPQAQFQWRRLRSRLWPPAESDALSARGKRQPAWPAEGAPRI